MFGPSMDWSHGNVNLRSIECLDSCSNKYKEVADAIVINLASATSDVDTLLCPVVSLYTQCLELKFKKIINLCEKIAKNKICTLDNYTLSSLWGIVKTNTILSGLLQNSESLLRSSFLSVIDGVVEEMTAIDPRTAFFCKCDSNMANETRYTHVNIVVMAQNVSVLWGYLNSQIIELENMVSELENMSDDNMLVV